ncbi:MAG TPA: hypothetical protein VFG10_16405 [Saprospiraceae bacterium]|nr:hypothetical protein [Saprospiraceae bacterium]
MRPPHSLKITTNSLLQVISKMNTQSDLFIFTLQKKPGMPASLNPMLLTDEKFEKFRYKS